MQQTEIVNNLKQIERDLYRVNQDLQHIIQLQSNIETIYTTLLAVADAVQGDPELDKAFQKELAGKQQLLPLLKDMNQKLEKLRSGIEQSKGAGERADSFMERFRNSHIYAFPDLNYSLDFFHQSMEVLGITMLYLTPEIIGMQDIDGIASELSLEKTRHGIQLHPRHLRSVINKLAQRSAVRNLRLECAELKALWRNPRTIYIESTNSRIKRLDRLCKTLNGTFLG